MRHSPYDKIRRHPSLLTYFGKVTTNVNALAYYIDVLYALCHIAFVYGKASSIDVAYDP